MNILIGYDGSDCADAALEDLKRAGLPSRADVMVLGIADVWPPPLPGTEEYPLDLQQIEELRETARLLLAKADSNATKAAQTVQSAFPAWNVRAESAPDSPAWGIIKRADEWPADLVVVGSHGMSATDRVFIGSVSQKVLTHATCSVRVARHRTNVKEKPLRLIIGFDGSTDAERALREVASRTWPESTEAQVVTVIDHGVKTAIMARVLKLSPAGAEGRHDHKTWLFEMAEQAAGQLQAVRLNATWSVPEGDPKRTLIDTAEQWGADCIFLGATGLRGLRRLLLGSVSAGVAAHAPCTVEVVRAG